MDRRDLLLEFVRHSARPLFLTGRAGTGKTTLLRYITQETYKSCVVAAPTGIAALNAQGITLHSLFQIPKGIYLPEEPATPLLLSEAYFTPRSYWRQVRMHDAKRQLLRSIELLIIDEVSMLRADTLDCIDMVLRRVRRSSLPFGGVQVLFIGDLLQLPPVVRAEEWQTLGQYYQSMFFFDAYALRSNPPIFIELDKVYRQHDDAFISILGNLRHNRLTQDDIARLNSYVRPDFDSTEHDGYVVLTTHNYKADVINERGMARLPGRAHIYEAQLWGDFPDSLAVPVERTLKLKVGARVMFVRNDSESPRRYYNGSIGIVTALDKDLVVVRPEGSDHDVHVERREWTNLRYGIDPETQLPTPETLGTLLQFPLRPAWAITVHKSQGLTFSHVALDLEQTFSSGQAYVALSRLTSLEGLVLLSPIEAQRFAVPEEVARYSEQRQTEQELQTLLQSDTLSYWCEQTLLAFNWRQLIDLWRDHLYSYTAESERSVKSHHGDWASEATNQMNQLYTLALRFRDELTGLWQMSPPNVAQIQARLDSAVGYFAPRLREVCLGIATTSARVRGEKKVKQYLGELEHLSGATVGVVRTLMRIQCLLKGLLERKPLDRTELGIDTRFDAWQEELNATIRERTKLRESATDDTPETTQQTRGRGRQSKPVRQRTQDLTLELWLAGRSIEEIALDRGLSVATISGHLAYQIEQRRLPPDAIIDLEQAEPALEHLRSVGKVTALKPIYDALGERYSYDQIRLILAYYETYLVDPETDAPEL